MHLVNAAGFAGFTDWRVPSKEELLGIVDTGIAGCGEDTRTPCIDPIFGPTQPQFAVPWYWSSTDLSFNNAVVVLFWDRTAGNGNKSSPFYVRAVRGGP